MPKPAEIAAIYAIALAAVCAGLGVIAYEMPAVQMAVVGGIAGLSARWTLPAPPPLRHWTISLAVVVWGAFWGYAGALLT